MNHKFHLVFIYSQPYSRFETHTISKQMYEITPTKNGSEHHKITSTPHTLYWCTKVPNSSPYHSIRITSHIGVTGNFDKCTGWPPPPPKMTWNTTSPKVPRFFLLVSLYGQERWMTQKWPWTLKIKRTFVPPWVPNFIVFHSMGSHFQVTHNVKTKIPNNTKMTWTQWDPHMHKFRTCPLLVHPRPNFQSISLYDEPFLHNRPFWDKCTNDLKMTSSPNAQRYPIHVYIFY